MSSVSIYGNGQVTIGAGTFIGHQVLIISGQAPITIGKCLDIAPGTVMVGGTREMGYKGERLAGKGMSLPITIHDGAWIGAHCTILPGVTIGKKSLIGAGSVVTSDIPDNSLAVGVPCTVKRRW